MIVFEMVELDVVSADNWELHGARIVVPMLGSAVKRLLIHAVETFPPVPMFIDLSNLVSLEWFAFMSGEISLTSALNMLHSIPAHTPLRHVTLAVATFIDPTWGHIPTSLVRFRRKIQMCIAYRALPANRDVVNTSSLVNVSYGTYAEVWDYILTGVHAQWIRIHVHAMSNWNDSSKKCTSLKLAPWGFVEASWLYPTNYVFARCAHTNNLRNKMLGYDEFEKSLYRETLICAIVHSEASWVPHMVRKPFQIMVYTTVQRFSDEASGWGPGGETKERVTLRVWVKVELDVEESVEDRDSPSMEHPISQSAAHQGTTTVGVEPGDTLSERIRVLDHMRSELCQSSSCRATVEGDASRRETLFEHEFSSWRRQR
ncbi:uncharacterized protein EV420DRAFT_1727469 [Desarmillaria tabescens]|uniref:Uncharacterized protein n=1 Tax=Armillaria tabescens TaxID=1929756 RepID=A0AA39JGL5_ARMTA|nr:uncharacterized protein EV420DRAFT_1727469 [Desarmillaria tabescens]KAK0442268.1 hypothetical protein EV420DRAFT_1727469 [Desarmillaria tabescens]